MMTILRGKWWLDMTPTIVPKVFKVPCPKPPKRALAATLASASASSPASRRASADPRSRGCAPRYRNERWPEKNKDFLGNSGGGEERGGEEGRGRGERRELLVSPLMFRA